MLKTNSIKTTLPNKFNAFKLGYFINNENELLQIMLKMIVLILLLFMVESTVLTIIIPIFTIPALLINKLVINKYYWLILSIATSIPYLINDLVGYVPNHKHIYAYVCIAVCAVLFMSDKSNKIQNLGTQSKYIIGLCFLFAVAGKFLAPEFLNGAFFEFTNTADPRFFGFTSQIAGVDMKDLLENEAHLNKLTKFNDPNFTFKLKGVENIGTIGLIISYWTILIEGMIAISFCVPQKLFIAKFRNIFLIAFIITTYPIATVPGFAILLTALGFIQSIKDNKLTNYSLFYLFVFFLLPLIQIPFVRVFNMIF